MSPPLDEKVIFSIPQNLREATEAFIMMLWHNQRFFCVDSSLMFSYPNLKWMLSFPYIHKSDGVQKPPTFCKEASI